MQNPYLSRITWKTFFCIAVNISNVSFCKERREKKFFICFCAKKSFTVKDVQSAAASMLLNDAKG